ncbi:SapC family protein [Alteromonas pelagimontana]|uniref:SapC family protein n=1 Tax=Alteromonas pelagimontana TaxID=1858656 RepID=A0A6M4MBU5_9ALTE|nr:SapC family protein [Alteromonas pelagimontana]QJR80661.1 SapC family protein [Alteromonas pelagimontana]
MAKNVLVNNVDHQDIKVIIERSETYGDNVWYTLTFPSEFRSLQSYYPVFFHKDANTGKFYAVALFGFENNENLFLKDNQWDAGYIPLTIARQPFSIGIHKVQENGEEKSQRMLHIDLENPRVNTEKGEALFLPHGGNSPYLDTVADMLEVIHHGMIDSEKFINTLIELELLESFTLDITLNDGSQYQMLGFYTINEDRLSELSADELAQLHRQEYLQPIYMAIASQANIRHLMNRKNALLGL